MDRDEISERIGVRLRAIRQQRHLSLDDVASITGVSKPMLGQIERGASNPTIATLWKIATGLEIPFTAFVGDEPAVQILRAGDQEVFYEEGEQFQAYSTFARRGVPVELFRLRVLPGTLRKAEPHNPGVVESITVTRGTLRIRVHNAVYDLNSGDAVTFPADVVHVYENPATEICEATMAILYIG